MRACAWLFGAWLLGCLALPSPASAAPATRAYVGVYLHDVTHFDQRNGTFNVDADVWLKWFGELDPSLLRVQNSSSELEVVDLGESNDGDWHSHRYHLRGALRGEFPLHRFPFDEQTLGIQFELPGVATELVPDLAGSGIAPRFSVTGWHYEPKFQPRVQTMVYASDLGTIEQEGRSTRISRVGFEVSLERPTITIAVKLFLPLVLLLLIALIALYLAPELVDARSSIGVTVLLACFAFQFTVAGTIPDVSYLTIVDQLFILSYALATLTLIVTVGAYWLHRTSRERLATKLDRRSRVVIPLVAMLATVVMLATNSSAEDVRAAPAAPSLPTRQPSARPLLRVGTLQLTSASVGLVRAGQAAGLTMVAADGGVIGHLAETAPTVASDQMEFDSDGTLVIRWTLRPGLAWSDGHALTSDDFRFALEVSPDPQIVTIETPDPRTLVLRYADALAYALEGFAPLPRHVLVSVKADGGFDAVAEARRQRILPSAGPYALVEFEANRRAVLVANACYVGAPPAIRRIEVQVFDSAEALASAFESGAIDLVMPGALTPAVATDLATRRADAVIVRPSRDLYALAPDPSVPLLAHRGVRRAILQSLDRAALARTVFGEHGAAAETPSRELSADEADATPFDAVAARATLEREGAVGASVRLSHTSRALDRRIAALVAEALTAVGLVVEDREVAPGSPEARARNHGGLMLTMIRGGDEDSDPRRHWNLPRTNGRIDATARNFAFDDETAQIVDRWSRALYAERRLQLVQSIDRAVARRLPLLPLAFGTERLAVLPTLRGWDEGRRFGDTAADWRFAE